MGAASRHFTPGAARDAVARSADGRYGVLLSHGSMELGYYRPRERDPQSPHRQDELYFVHAGQGVFFLDGKRIPFGPGDALFVPAGALHRFESFSEDFGAWVVFWGPDGGEGA